MRANPKKPANTPITPLGGPPPLKNSGQPGPDASQVPNEPRVPSPIRSSSPVRRRLFKEEEQSSPPKSGSLAKSPKSAALAIGDGRYLSPQSPRKGYAPSANPVEPQPEPAAVTQEKFRAARGATRELLLALLKKFGRDSAISSAIEKFDAAVRQVSPNPDDEHLAAQLMRLELDGMLNEMSPIDWIRLTRVLTNESGRYWRLNLLKTELDKIEKPELALGPVHVTAAMSPARHVAAASSDDVPPSPDFPPPPPDDSPPEQRSAELLAPPISNSLPVIDEVDEQAPPLPEEPPPPLPAGPPPILARSAQRRRLEREPDDDHLPSKAEEPHPSALKPAAGLLTPRSPGFIGAKTPKTPDTAMTIAQGGQEALLKEFTDGLAVLYAKTEDAKEMRMKQPGLFARNVIAAIDRYRDYNAYCDKHRLPRDIGASRLAKNLATLLQQRFDSKDAPAFFGRLDANTLDELYSALQTLNVQAGLAMIRKVKYDREEAYATKIDAAIESVRDLNIADALRAMADAAKAARQIPNAAARSKADEVMATCSDEEVRALGAFLQGEFVRELKRVVAEAEAVEPTRLLFTLDLLTAVVAAQLQGRVLRPAPAERTSSSSGVQHDVKAALVDAFGDNWDAAG